MCQYLTTPQVDSTPRDKERSAPPHPHHPLIFFFFLRGAMIAALLFLLLQCHHLQARTQHRASCCYTPSYFKNNGGERNKLRQCTVVVARAPDALGSEPLFITTPLTGWTPCSSSEAFFLSEAFLSLCAAWKLSPFPLSSSSLYAFSYSLT